MDTIKNYLDNMFLGLPQNEQTQKAKEELLAMMEDKYLELKKDGKTENEAIGIVISEFGNLEEVSDSLGIGVNLDEKTEKNSMLSSGDVKAYLQAVREHSSKIALGVGVMIAASSVLLFLLGFFELGLLQMEEKNVPILGIMIMFLFSALGIHFIVRSSIQLSKYKDIRNKEISLDPVARREVNLMREEETEKFSRVLGLSIVMYVLSIIPLFATIFIFGKKNEGMILISLGVFMLIVAAATYNITRSYGLRNAVNKLIKKEPTTKRTVTPGKVSTIYWSIVTASYLAYSFLTEDWSRSWIIWPVAAVLYAGIVAFFNKE